MTEEWAIYPVLASAVPLGLGFWRVTSRDRSRIVFGEQRARNLMQEWSA